MGVQMGRIYGCVNEKGCVGDSASERVCGYVMRMGVWVCK